MPRATFSANGTGRTGTVQTWTVPSSDYYNFTVIGASGCHGTLGTTPASSVRYGYGARVVSQHYLLRGQQLRIVVGQQGKFNGIGNSYGVGGSGGGYSAVFLLDPPFVENSEHYRFIKSTEPDINVPFACLTMSAGGSGGPNMYIWDWFQYNNPGMFVIENFLNLWSNGEATGFNTYSPSNFVEAVGGIFSTTGDIIPGSVGQYNDNNAIGGYQPSTGEIYGEGGFGGGLASQQQSQWTTYTGGGGGWHGRAKYLATAPAGTRRVWTMYSWSEGTILEAQSGYQDGDGIIYIDYPDPPPPPDRDPDTPPVWQQPIYDRSQADVDFARANSNNIGANKGALNYTDMLRITGNIRYLWQKFNIQVPRQSKSIWTIGEIAPYVEFQYIYNDIITLYHNVGGGGDIQLPFNNFRVINEIEYYLWSINS